VFPCYATRPTASNLNYQPDDVVPNTVLAKVGTDDNVCIFTLATTDVIVDVMGYVPTDGAGNQGLLPGRLLIRASLGLPVVWHHGA
jgi:hypothetical protein